MRKVIIAVTLLLFVTSVAFAAPFVPTVMKVSAPAQIQYDFGGKTLAVPVTVTGVGGSAFFLVFTKDKASTISKVTNGYLGWHYVNKIDTCLYVSPLKAVNKGSNAINWDGKDEGGNVVPKGDYTYYIFAFDDVSPRIQMTKQMTLDPWGFRTIITHTTEGKPLAQPIFYRSDSNRSGVAVPVNHTNKKWVVGGDPEDVTLLETTTSEGWCDAGGLAFLPTNYKFYFHNTQKEASMKITRKFEWVPNGKSVLQTDWGNDGQFTYEVTGLAGNQYGPGCVSDGKDYLLMSNADILDKGTQSDIIYVDINTGEQIKRLDVSNLWVNMSDREKKAQANGGPSEVFIRNGMMFLGSHTTCMNSMMDVYYEDEAEALLWANGNGDITGDHNWEPNTASGRPWVCNDYNVAPYKYCFVADANLFSAFPSFDMGAVTFGLYAPDGTGMSYQSLAGETAYQKYGFEFVDYDSAYDGIYTTSNVGRTKAGCDNTIWYVSHDSIRGVISYQIGVAEAPAAFSVAQNVPNPFNPATTINFTLAKAGKVTVDVFNVAGQKVDTIASGAMSAGSHSVTWNASKFSAGMYFYTVKSGEFSKTMKMTLLK